MNDLRVDEHRHPVKLYIRIEDKIKGIQESQSGLNHQLREDIQSKDLEAVEDTLVNIVDETLAEPRSGSLQTAPETVDILVRGYAGHPGVIRGLVTMAHRDYTTAIHSINVMALTLGYCFYTGYSQDETKKLGLSALLHDIGKTEIPPEILKAQRKLSPGEFVAMQKHPAIGYEILEDAGFDLEEVKMGCLQHHEKLDGSGYLEGTHSISAAGQILGIIDCYEALTNDDRLYRRPMAPLKTLEIIKEDVEVGKFSRTIFEKFAYSLI